MSSRYTMFHVDVFSFVLSIAKQAAKQAQQLNQQHKKFVPKVSPTDYHRFIYKCHTCLLGKCVV